MTSTHPASLILRLICAAGFIHGKATSPRQVLTGQYFTPRPFGPDFKGMHGRSRFYFAEDAWKAEEDRLAAEWTDRQALRRQYLLGAYHSAAGTAEDAAPSAIAALKAAEAVESDWDPQARAFIPARNPWIGCARRALEGALAEADEKLIATKLDRCLANAAAAKAQRAQG